MLTQRSVDTSGEVRDASPHPVHQHRHSAHRAGVEVGCACGRLRPRRRPDIGHELRRRASAGAGALSLMQRFSRIERIAIGAVMDDHDLGGPKSQSDVDDFATL